MKLLELNNGVKIVTVPVKGLNSVTIEAFVKIGSKYEKTSEFGLSHFLEHMAFKGTKKRPTAKLINNEIDGKGAAYNAGTGFEATSYHITTVRENLAWASEILSDILFNSVYDEGEVIKERGVIIEEIRMYKDNPMMGLSGEFVKFLYGNSPIGCWNISGEVEDIQRIERKDVVNFRDKYFNPKEMVVVLAGDVLDDDLQIVKDNFSVFNNDKATSLPEVKVNLTEIKKMVVDKPGEQAHFAIGLPALPWTDERKYALRMLDIILGGNSSSRLHAKIREDRGWAYYVYSISESFKETGFMAIQSGVKKEKLEEALEVVRQEMEMMKDTISEEELKRSKDYLLGKIKLSMDRTDFWTSFVGEKLLLENRLVSVEDQLDKYRQLIINDLKEVGESIFVKKNIRDLIMV